MGNDIKLNSVKGITSPIPPSPPIAPKRPTLGGKVIKGRAGAQQITAAALKTAKAALAPTKQAVCDQIQRHAKLAEQLAFSGDDADLVAPQLEALCSSLAANGRALLDASHGKNTMKGIRGTVNDFKSLTAKHLARGDFKIVASICMNYSEELDRLGGIKRPKAKPPTKKAISNFVLGHAKIVASLVTAENPRGDLADEVRKLTDKLVSAGEDMSNSLSGPHMRTAISSLISDFKQALAQPVDPNDPEKIADLCLNFAARLDEIVVIKRPEGAYNFSVRS